MADTPESKVEEPETPAAVETEAPVPVGNEHGEQIDEDISLSSGAEEAAAPQLDSEEGETLTEPDNNNKPSEPEPARFIAFSWNDYKSMLEAQKTIANQEKQQGKKNALGYQQINPEDKTTLRNLQKSLFGAKFSHPALGEVGYHRIDPDEEKRKRDLQEYYAECEEKGKPVNEVTKSGFTCYEDKLFDGFRLDKNMLNGNPTLSFRLKDENGRHQQIYDDGNSVKACTNGPFNARTAMGMAAMFWGHRATIAAHPSTPHEHRVLDVNINTKKTIGGAMGGVTAKQKQDYMIIANLHHSHKVGVKANIKGNNIGDLSNIEDLKKYASDNAKDLQDAFDKYRQAIPSGEENGFTLEDLLGDPRDEATNAMNLAQERRQGMKEANKAKTPESVEDTDTPEEMDEDISLSGDDDQPPAPAAEADGDIPPENDGGGSGTELEIPEDDEPKAQEGEILDASEADPFTSREVVPASEREAIDGNIIDAEFEDVVVDSEPAQIAQTKALPHDQSLDSTKPAEDGVPTFKTQRDPNAVVASEPRQSHGNDVPAQSKWVQGMISAEKAKTADAALGGQDKNLPAAPSSTAVINPAQKADDAATPKPSDRRIQGPTGTPGM
jgi:hypothetical protein